MPHQAAFRARLLPASQSDRAVIGITARNIDAGQIELRRVEGFTIGMRTLGDGRVVEDTFGLWPSALAAPAAMASRAGSTGIDEVTLPRPQV